MLATGRSPILAWAVGKRILRRMDRMDENTFIADRQIEMSEHSGPEYQSRVLDAKRLRQAERYLAQADPVLGKVIRAIGPCGLCGEESDPFEQLCIAIIGQQLSVKAAQTICERVRQAVLALTPSRILATEDDALRAAGISRPKIRYLKALAGSVASGELVLSGLKRHPPEQVVLELVKVPGIGKWTAEMFLIFNLNHSDVLSLGDAGLQRATRLLYGESATLQAVGEKWRPYCSVASWYLWQYLDARLLD